MIARTKTRSEKKGQTTTKHTFVIYVGDHSLLSQLADQPGSTTLVGLGATPVVLG